MNISQIVNGNGSLLGNMFGTVLPIKGATMCAVKGPLATLNPNLKIENSSFPFPFHYPYIALYNPVYDLVSPILSLPLCAGSGL